MYLMKKKIYISSFSFFIGTFGRQKKNRIDSNENTMQIFGCDFDNLYFDYNIAELC